MAVAGWVSESRWYPYQNLYFDLQNLSRPPHQSGGSKPGWAARVSYRSGIWWTVGSDDVYNNNSNNNELVVHGAVGEQGANPPAVWAARTQHTSTQAHKHTPCAQNQTPNAAKRADEAFLHSLPLTNCVC